MDWLCTQGRGMGHHLELICAILCYFTFLRWHQCPSRLVRVFLGTLWSSINEIKAPYVFDWEHGVALHAVHGNRPSSPGKRGSFMVFLELRQEPGVYSRVTGGWPFESPVCSVTSELLSSYNGHLRNLN